jgi:hypothetical protein
MKPIKIAPCLSYSALLIMIFLVSCTPAPSTAPPTQAPRPATDTPAPPIPSATPILHTPTETPIPPTATPTKKPTRTPRLATSPEDILGTWLGIENRDGMYIRFNDDGTCQLATSLKSLNTQPNVRCTYSFEENHLIFTEVNTYNLPECGPTPAKYQVELLPTGQIDFIKVEDRCGPRVSTFVQVHERQP